MAVPVPSPACRADRLLRRALATVRALVACAALFALAALAALPPAPVLAAPVETDDTPPAPEQLGRWRGITLEGATCGGAPNASGERPAYKYYLSPGTADEAGILFVLSGGGVCLKEGPAPPGATGAAAQLHCMSFSNFQDPVFRDLFFVTDLAPETAIPFFRRSDNANPFRDYTFVAVPYCTGDVHAGQMTQGHDYDPDPAGTFEVLHRGHLNVLAVLEDVQRRYPGDVPVVLTGMSAGGFGAIYNFPDVVRRWPRTTLIPDAGIAPPAPTSLMAREGQRMAERWGARALLPTYCQAPECLADTMRLLGAHAAAYDGHDGRPWRPFGLLQSQQDATLSNYLEISACSYELGLRRGLALLPADNLRAFVPASTNHVFSAVNPLSPAFRSQLGVNPIEWFRLVAMATSPEALPPSAVDPWLPCNPLALPFGVTPGP